MAWNGDNRWDDDMDDTVTLEVNDNADGEHVILNVVSDSGDEIAVGIALNSESLDSLIEQLQILQAGL